MSAQSPVFASGATPSADALRAAQAQLTADPSLQFTFGPQPPPPPPPPSLDMPDWLAGLLRGIGGFFSALGPVFGWIFVAGLAAGLLAVLYFVFREALRTRFPALFKRKAGPARPKPEEWRPDAATARALLEEADRLAAAGDYAAAVRLLLHKSIEEIDGRRPSLVRPAYTSREIGQLDDLPPAARTTFGHIAEVVERSFFGGRAVDASGFAECRRTYEQFAFPGGVGVSEAGGAGASRPIFSARTAIILAVVGVFAFSAFVTLLAYAPDVQQNSDCKPDVYAKCAIGFAGLAAAVGADGQPAVVSRSAPMAQGRTEGLLIATPEPGGAADVAALGFGGPVLVILPKWAFTPDPNNNSWADKAGLLPPDQLPLKDLLEGVTVRRGPGVARPQLWGQRGTPLEGASLMPGPIDQLQTMTAPDGWIPVLTDNNGNVVMAEAPGTRIFVLSDPDLLNTQGLANLDTFADATVLIRSLRNGDGPVIFDVTLDGIKSERNPLRLMFDPPFLAVTLCLAGALLLVGFQSLFRFGPVRRPVRALALGKEALTDNSAQLIRIARREMRMAPGYVAMTQKAAARAVGAPKELSGDALVAFLDRVGAQRGLTDRLAGMTQEAAAVKNRDALTGLAGRLYRWRLEMTRERQ